MKPITNIRKAVCTMANELRKAWSRIKLSMTVRVTGTTFEKRQERLQFLKRFRLEDLKVTLECEPNNQYDKNAIQVVIHIIPLHRETIIGYIPKGLARELSKVLEKEIEVKAKLLQIIGGYSYKETLGALLNITI